MSLITERKENTSMFLLIVLKKIGRKRDKQYVQLKKRNGASEVVKSNLRVKKIKLAIWSILNNKKIHN